MPLFEVYRSLGAGFGTGGTPGAWLNTLGQQVVMDWQQAMLLDGRGYQVRAGTISAPVTGDGTAITDTAAEMSADAASGTTIIPVFAQVAVDTPTTDDGEMAIKSVATVSSSGTAFVPLPLKSDGSAATSTARVQATGNVTVTAEVATTTLRHYSTHFQEGSTEADAQVSVDAINWEPKAAPVLVGARCFYVQVALWTYMAHFDYIEVPTLLINPS